MLCNDAHALAQHNFRTLGLVWSRRHRSLQRGTTVGNTSMATMALVAVAADGLGSIPSCGDHILLWLAEVCMYPLLHWFRARSFGSEGTVAERVVLVARLAEITQERKPAIAEVLGQIVDAIR